MMNVCCCRKEEKSVRVLLILFWGCHRNFNETGVTFFLWQKVWFLSQVRSGRDEWFNNEANNIKSKRERCWQMTMVFTVI